MTATAIDTVVRRPSRGHVIAAKVDIVRIEQRIDEIVQAFAVDLGAIFRAARCRRV